MKKLLSLFVFCFLLQSAHAARLEDVTILDVVYEEDSFEVKLHANEGPADSYFFVNILKSDEAALQKMALILKKHKAKKKFKLGLNIPSFSMSPSGSSYPSDHVRFDGAVSSESVLP